ncbi:MAG: hypothetical protein DRJ07_06820, partial [Bacteroidetes bacterium]
GATNESGFTALPGGSRDKDGVSWALSDYGIWWDASEVSDTTARDHVLISNDAGVF